MDLSTRGELVASEARGVELGLAADAAHRACGALERACDQRRLAHAFASVEHCARRCTSAAAVAAGAAACARLGQKARAWRAVAKDGRARTKEALGDLELLKAQLEEARAAEARAATLAVRARELEADRRKLRDEIATRDAAQRLGRLERRPSVSPLSPATARRRSPSPRGFQERRVRRGNAATAGEPDAFRRVAVERVAGPSRRPGAARGRARGPPARRPRRARHAPVADAYADDHDVVVVVRLARLADVAGVAGPAVSRAA